jgi:hypothetical protein
MISLTVYFTKQPICSTLELEISGAPNKHTKKNWLLTSYEQSVKNSWKLEIRDSFIGRTYGEQLHETGSTSNCGIFEKDSESQLTSHNLLLCFLNETPSDLEEDATEDTIDDTKVRIPLSGNAV